MSLQNFISSLSVCALLAAPICTNAADTDAEIEARIEKVGSISITGAAEPTKATDTQASAPADGAALYQTSCFACHGTGVANAPKLGDSAAWAARIAKGEEALVSNAINGTGGMPAKGGNASLSDDEIRAIVAYMIARFQ